MNRRKLQKTISPGKAALLVLLVLGIVQYVWWRGLVYRPKHVPDAPPPQQTPTRLDMVNLRGREDVFVDTYAGDTEPGDADGPGFAARLDRPTGLALDAQGNLYVADTGNHRIRKISPEGHVSTLAGSDVGNSDGPALQARFNAPCGVAVAPDGTVYVADTGNHCLRRIQNGQVVTLNGPSTNGPATVGKSQNLKQASFAEHTVTPCAWGQKSLFPTEIAFVPTADPYLLVTDPVGKQLLHCRLDGGIVSVQRLAFPPTGVAGTPQLAIATPQSGGLQFGVEALHDTPIVGAEVLADVKKRPALHHPTSVCRLGNGWLVADDSYGALFLVRQGMRNCWQGRFRPRSLSVGCATAMALTPCLTASAGL